MRRVRLLQRTQGQIQLGEQQLLHGGLRTGHALSERIQVMQVCRINRWCGETPALQSDPHIGRNKTPLTHGLALFRLIASRRVAPAPEVQQLPQAQNASEV
jgi:hypothetical protein